MQAQPGDVLIVEGQIVGQQARRATILEVRGADGAPPYLIQYPDGHEALTFPGPDAHVLHED
ncbi:MAG TPA: DUF1918 domain-containing protein [Jatrophihabitans sp.]|nr:DUF1918 domain-containing protein [Jatrophihabitans sp.]